VVDRLLIQKQIHVLFINSITCNIYNRITVIYRVEAWGIHRLVKYVNYCIYTYLVSVSTRTKS